MFDCRSSFAGHFLHKGRILFALIEGVGGGRDKTIRVLKKPLFFTSNAAFPACTTSTKWFLSGRVAFLYTSTSVSSKIFCVLAEVRIMRFDSEFKVNNVDRWETRNAKTSHFQAWWNLCNIDCPQSSRSVEWGVWHFLRALGAVVFVSDSYFMTAPTKRSHMVIQTGPALKSPPS